MSEKMSNDKVKETISEGVVNLIRAFVRPCVTLYLTVLWGTMYWSILQQGGNIGNIDPAFTAFVWGLDAWWFGDRSLLKGKGLLQILRGEGK